MIGSLAFLTTGFGLALTGAVGAAHAARRPSRTNETQLAFLALGALGLGMMLLNVGYNLHHNIYLGTK